LVIGGISSLVVGAAVAQAALTLYAETSYRVPIGMYSVAQTSPTNLSSGVDNTLSSHDNATGWTVALAHDKNLAGHCFQAAPWTKDPDFWFFDDNAVSSLQVGRACP
jgi:hypothetical protein